MTSILVCGGDSWANRGDAAILAGTVASLREQMPDVWLTVASGRPGVTAGQGDFRVVDRRNPAALLAAIRRAGLMLWGGGQLLQNASSRPFLLAQLALVQAAHLLGTPVMGFAQGVGAVTGNADRVLARRVVAGLRCFTVRDAQSAQALHDLGVAGLPVEVTADPALLAELGSTDRGAATLRAEELPRRFVVFALRRWGHYRGGWLPVRAVAQRPAADDEWFDDLLTVLAQAADHLVRRWDVDVLFVPMCPGADQHDDEVGSIVRERMAFPERSHLLPRETGAKDLAAVFGAAEAVVSIRMHPLILAALSHVPGIALSYQGKGAAFLDRVGLGRYALPVEEVTVEGLTDRLDALWEERQGLRDHLAKRLPALQAAARRNATCAAELLGFAAGPRVQPRKPPQVRVTGAME